METLEFAANFNRSLSRKRKSLYSAGGEAPTANGASNDDDDDTDDDLDDISADTLGLERVGLFDMLKNNILRRWILGDIFSGSV